MPSTINIKFDNADIVRDLCGEHNKNLKILADEFGVSISVRGTTLLVSGEHDKIMRAESVIATLYKALVEKNFEINNELIRSAINSSDISENKSSNDKHKYLKTRRKQVHAQNYQQEEYIEKIDKHDIVFGLGVAGTGKTYLAVAEAVSMFLEKKVEKIILTRPIVEAGEKLGFLPGDIREKIDPYLQPLYDALYDMLPAENIERYFTTREIEIAPLAFMRGRTLTNAFIILDEAQNVNSMQMKMFLTRLGLGSKMVITGDISQTDLPSGTRSGLIEAVDKLKNIDEIAIVNFTIESIVRHPLTKKIIKHYEGY